MLAKVATELNRLISRRREPERERVWWTERRLANPVDMLNVQASHLIPDGSVVHEVQITGRPKTEVWDWNLAVWLAIVSSASPTQAEIEGGEPIIAWQMGDQRTTWWSSTSIIQECYPMHKTLHGSHMRFAFSARTVAVIEAIVRVSVLYSLP